MKVIGGGKRMKQLFALVYKKIPLNKKEMGWFK